MTLRQRFAVLFALVGAGVSLTFVDTSGTPTEDPAQISRVCMLPQIIPLAWLSVLNIPTPTQADGTGTGRCLPPADAEDAFRKLRIAGAILPKWRAANMTSSQCAAGIVHAEFAPPGVGGGAAGSEHTEVAVAVCGPAPAAQDTVGIEALEKLPGTAVEVVSTFGPVARPAALAGVVIRWWKPPYPAALVNLFPCAMRCSEAATCTVGGLAAQVGVQLEPGTWTGAGCTRKPCGEFLGTADVLGLNYSSPCP